MIFYRKEVITMKRIFAVMLCVLMVGSMFAFAISANAEGEDEVTAITTVDDGTVIDDKVEEAPVGADDGVSTEVPAASEGTTAPETPTETAAQTPTETVAATTAPTVAPSQAATVAPTQAPTQPAKNANSPKTGDNMWLFIGIGIFAVALIAIIITVVVKKKAK